MTNVEAILKKLRSTKGLKECFILDEDDKENIRELEEARNVGVMECLDRKFTLVVVHDSKFRSPQGDIVKKKGRDVEFPAVPFSEVSEDAISSCPSKLVHHFLIERFHLHVHPDEATLLIGFD